MHVCLFFFFFLPPPPHQKVSVFVSVLTLTAISVERWMAICQPFMFRQTAVRARRIICVVWLVALSCAVPDLVGMTLHRYPHGAMCQPMWTHRAEELHLLLIFVLFYVVPLVIMTFTYVRVALCLWRSGSMGDADEAAASVPRAQMLLRKKKAKMLIVVVLLFALCYLPVYLLFIFMATGLLEYIPTEALPPLAMLAHWLCYFNSSVNPVIYNFMSCNFRREFQVACFICCRRGSESRMTAYEAMRLRNVLRTQQASRASHHEISGLTRTESTMLTTPVLNGRRGLAGDGVGGTTSGPATTGDTCSSTTSTRRTRLSATPLAVWSGHRDCLYSAVLAGHTHRVNPRDPLPLPHTRDPHSRRSSPRNPKMTALMEIL
ncbi:hypothetical protein ACOMHN_032589 [Nucella lapillus]